MTTRETTLGGFIADLMEKHKHTNRSLAAAAGISEGAVRNVLKIGIDNKAKDPDARTLLHIATALNVDPLRLYRLAGYLPPAPSARSVRAEFVADIFDHLPIEKQEAVLGVLDAMADSYPVSHIVKEIRSDRSNPLAGFDLLAPRLVRLMANELISKYKIVEPVDINRIEGDAQVYQYKWKDLPASTQERVKALIRHKLSLDYDPTMVDPEWRS
jgi:transcriptional regulator with XRE-family HTH domain